MKVALVHDFIKEYGGAERVLSVLSEIYPRAPIYTAFKVDNSTGGNAFAGKRIIESKLAPLLKIWRLYSPLRFLIPFIWSSFDLSSYDLVITSSSWYITKGFKISPKTKVMCYCHTPPRWLYGYTTSVGFTKYWPVKLYSLIVGHFLRMYDFVVSQKPDRSKKKIIAGVDVFIANSKNVQARIKKFYRRDSVVIYPPCDVVNIIESTKKTKKEKFLLIVSRFVGAKGLEEAVLSAKNMNLDLKIVGESHGFAEVENKLKKLTGGSIKMLGRVDDKMLYQLYAKAVGFIALARDEDFGMTPVESQAAGTPVIAFNGGGFKESVIDGRTGILVDDTDFQAMKKAVEKLQNTSWKKADLQKNAMRFSKECFIREFTKLVTNTIKNA